MEKVVLFRKTEEGDLRFHRCYYLRGDIQMVHLAGLLATRIGDIVCMQRYCLQRIISPHTGQEKWKLLPQDREEVRALYEQIARREKDWA
jgi:hypothetical protein